MKKKLLFAAGIAVMMGTMVACSEVSEEDINEVIEAVAEEAYVTYEFETYDGDNVVLDASNIVSQVALEDDMELPAGADTVAPGRSIIYGADETNYYIIDTEKGLFTTAVKGESANATATSEEADASTEAGVVKNDDFTITFNAENFTVVDDYADGGCVELAYADASGEALTPNSIYVSKIEATTINDVLTQVASNFGDTEENISISSFGEDGLPALVYANPNIAAEESDYPIVDSYMAVQRGEDVILIEQIRTIGNSDEVEMTIDAIFGKVLEDMIIPN